MPQYRAWRFHHPDFDASEAHGGLAIAHSGGIGMVEDIATIRQAILLLLSHVPGERVMRPDYGCEIYKLVFMNNDATTAGLAIHYVRQAIERWEPRVQILRVDANPNSSDVTRLDIFLEYRVHKTRQEDRFTFSISLAGEET